MSARRTRLAVAALSAAFGLAALAHGASAEGLSDVGGAEWRVEQPEPPAPPPGVQGSSTPIGLGRIGDIEFFSPDRGALITAGNGSTIPPGVWLYNGERWRELASVCGATDGRIAWSGPDEFWTISDGRPGQALANGERPPLQDNTLCHFAPPPGDPTGPIEVVASYASPAFESTSYRAMHAAACLSPSDCWFAGDALQNPQIGAFQLHWNGSSLEPAPYLPEGHAVTDMREFEGQLYSSVRLLESDRVLTVLRHPPPLHLLEETEGNSTWEGVSGLPLYGEGEFFAALDFLHLSDSEQSLWGAAGPALETPAGSAEAGVTVIRKEGGGGWTQLLGPETTPTGLERFPGDIVDAIAAEPGGEAAWIALDTKVDAISEEPNPDALAQVLRISADGDVSDELTLPSSEEPFGPKGAADKLTCPATHDCWLTTTTGWLLHLAAPEERTLAPDTDPVFAGEEAIDFRPRDLGVPQLPPDAPPIDESGLQEAPPEKFEPQQVHEPVNPFATITVPLLSGLHTRLVHRTRLELKFHLSVKASVQLVAKRKRTVVAHTATRTFSAGNRSLSLRLNVKRWPTKLALHTKALAPLKTTTTREGGSAGDTVSTSLVFPRTGALLESGLLH